MNEWVGYGPWGPTFHLREAATYGIPALRVGGLRGNGGEYLPCVCVCVDGEMRVLERLSGVCERRLIREVNEWVMDVQKWFLEWRTT